MKRPQTPGAGAESASGRHLLASVYSAQAANAGLFAIPLDRANEKRRILPDTTRTLFASGHLLGIRDGVLTARPFDARRLTAGGEAVPIAPDAATWAVVPDFGWFSASANGRLAWYPSPGRDLQLAWFDRQGLSLGTLGEPAKYRQVALSPDGRRVAVEVQDAEGRYDIWLIDVARGISSRLTTDPASEREPVWSPDGRRLAFTTDAGGDQNILVKDLSRSEPAAPLPGGAGATSGERDLPDSWSRVGNTLLFMTLGKERTFWALPMDGKGQPERLLAGQFDLDEPHVSPDGRWLAYVSTLSGRYEVYVQPFRRPGEPQRVSSDGGGQPRWRGDGKEILYVSLGGAVVSVSVHEAGESLELGAPRTLFSTETLRAVFLSPDYDDWDVTPDGQRFLVKVPPSSDRHSGIHVMLEWPSLVGD